MTVNLPEISPEALALLQEFIESNPIRVAVVPSEEEFVKAVAFYVKQGRRLAAVSNCGLPEGKRRLSFLPESAFVKIINE